MIGKQSAEECYYQAGPHSVVPRPHPLKWKDSLVNQVKFLTLQPAALNTFCTPPTQKIMGYEIYCCKENN